MTVGVETASGVVRPALAGPLATATPATAETVLEGGGTPLPAPALTPTLEAPTTVPATPAPAPTPPWDLYAEPIVNGIRLHWTPSQDVLGYVVSRATASGGPYTAISTFRGANPRYTDTTVSNGTTYFYRVAAHRPNETELSHRWWKRAWLRSLVLKSS